MKRVVAILESTTNSHFQNIVSKSGILTYREPVMLFTKGDELLVRTSYVSRLIIDSGKITVYTRNSIYVWRALEPVEDTVTKYPRDELEAKIRAAEAALFYGGCYV